MLFIIFQGDTVSKELSLHPVHLTQSEKGDLPPSAFVPFCSYQSDKNLLGKREPELNNLTVCDKFEPTILEGQLCYSLDIAKVGKRSTKTGKTNGLWILLDPNPFRTNVSSEMKPDDQKFKIYVHTLAQYTAFGPGEYGMSAFKSLKGTQSFKELPDNQKKCHVHNQEECETKQFLEQVLKSCNCVPWVFTADSEKVGVSLLLNDFKTSISQFLKWA